MNYLAGHWSFDPFVLIAAAVAGLHEMGLRNLARRSGRQRWRRRRRRSLAFYGGLALLLLAITSPMDYWASRYFFIHMTEHVLIMFFAPALVVVGAPWLPLLHGIPVRARRSLMRQVLLGPWAGPLRTVGRAASRGWVAVVVFNLAMVAWHLPVLFDLAERNQFVHIWLMHSSFFVAGVLFWLQVVPSYPLEPRLTNGAQIGAVLLTNVAMVFLAMALSIFTSRSVYPVYDHLPGVSLSPFASQQIGAALLWVCGDFWAYPALVVLIRRAMAAEGGAGAFVDKVLHVPAALERAAGE